MRVLPIEASAVRQSSLRGNSKHLQYDNPVYEVIASTTIQFTGKEQVRQSSLRGKSKYDNPVYDERASTTIQFTRKEQVRQSSLRGKSQYDNPVYEERAIHD
ncbi:hypothetical protein DPMN_060333 [Dreissena polymorpha]|uniref:Uncharacterized protein n=1 Tax=Dreissena polymorpha TaxID=45954 RepID=A0A9D4HFW9_DREPO|nr:hypothetical protein DPMN_060333 [Dreissena polymorpha]